MKNPLFSVSIRRLLDDNFSFDVRQFQPDGVLAPCGICRIFRWLDDGFIFVKEATGKDIPGYWPNLNQWDWKQDFIQVIN